MKPRSAVLIIRDHKILLLERTKSTEPVFYVLPGGGVEAGETPEQAAIRELHEELGVDITIQSKQLDSLQTDRQTWIIHAQLAPGAEPTWIETHKQTPDNHYKIVWLTKAELKGLRVFPKGLLQII